MTENTPEVFHRLRKKQERHLIPMPEAEHIAYAIKPYVELGNRFKDLIKNDPRETPLKTRYISYANTLDKLTLREAKKAGLHTLSTVDRTHDIWEIPQDHAHIVYAAEQYAEMISATFQPHVSFPQDVVLFSEIGAIDDESIRTKVDDIHTMMGIGISQAQQEADKTQISYERESRVGILLKQTMVLQPNEQTILTASVVPFAD